MLSPRAQQALSSVPAFRGLGEDDRKQVAGSVVYIFLEQRTSDARTVIDSHQLKQVRMEFLRSIDRRNLASSWADAK